MLKPSDETYDGQAYRDYLIRHLPIYDEWCIQKDNQLISWAKDLEDAKETIDFLTREC